MDRIPRERQRRREIRRRGVAGAVLELDESLDRFSLAVTQNS
jgi:hypothetical protein